jgi:hypothetical protein
VTARGALTPAGVVIRFLICSLSLLRLMSLTVVSLVFWNFFWAWVSVTREGIKAVDTGFVTGFVRDLVFYFALSPSPG